jgi:hypothetical protein
MSEKLETELTELRKQRDLAVQALFDITGEKVMTGSPIAEKPGLENALTAALRNIALETLDVIASPVEKHYKTTTLTHSTVPESKEPKRPDKVGICLLQTKHMYDESKIVKVIYGGGFTVGKDTLVIEVNRMAWGMFEQQLLKVLKNRQDLRDWAPKWFGDEKPCEKCKGVGGFPYTPGTEEYDEAYDDFYKFNGKLEENAPAYGVGISRFCSPCQGTGLVLKSQPEPVAPQGG